MDESKKGEEKKSQSQTTSEDDVDRQISNEAQHERVERSHVYTKPPKVSMATDTADDPFPSRKKKRKKTPPAVPAKRRSGENDSQTETLSADSTSQPRSQPSLRSASSEYPSRSRTFHRDDKRVRSRSLEQERFSSLEITRESEAKARRHGEYPDGYKEDGISPRGETSFHWRANPFDLPEDGFLSGLTGFIMTALAMGLLIMVSWFIISQMDFILKVVTRIARSIEESMALFSTQRKPPRQESLRE